MFTLPKKRMPLIDTMSAIFSCWKSLVLPLLPLSFLCIFLTRIPVFIAKHWSLIPEHIALVALLYAICYAIYLIPSGAIITRISHSLHGKTLTSVEAIKISLSRFLKMFLLSIILLAIMYILARVGLLFSHINPKLGLGIAFLFIVIASPYLIPANPLVVIDNKWPHVAIVTGFRLVNNNWGSVFVVLLVISLITIAVNKIASLLGLTAMFVADLFILPLTLSMAVMITENLKLSK